MGKVDGADRVEVTEKHRGVIAAAKFLHPRMKYNIPCLLSHSLALQEKRSSYIDERSVVYTPWCSVSQLLPSCRRPSCSSLNARRTRGTAG